MRASVGNEKYDFARCGNRGSDRTRDRRTQSHSKAEIMSLLDNAGVGLPSSEDGSSPRASFRTNALHILFSWMTFSPLKTSNRVMGA